MRNLESWTIAPTAEFWTGLHYNEYRRPEVESWEVSWDNIRISCSKVYLMTPNDLTSGSVFRYTVISIMKVIHFSTTFLVQIPSTIRKYWHFPEFECLLFTGKILWYCVWMMFMWHTEQTRWELPEVSHSESSRRRTADWFFTVQRHDSAQQSQTRHFPNGDLVAKTFMAWPRQDDRHTMSTS